VSTPVSAGSCGDGASVSVAGALDPVLGMPSP
jgi:hypothetical protein